MSVSDLHAHLSTGTTHVCHCWVIVRSDQVTMGFTDHDRPITFDGITFAPESGLSAQALASTTGLSVNNTEAIGVLQSNAISEADIAAGRYDGAAVTTWMVRWDNPSARQIRFTGTIGEITRAQGGFQAELRGLSDALNQPQGRSFLTSCSALLGDSRCGFDLGQTGFRQDVQIGEQFDAQVFHVPNIGTQNARWFETGVFEVETGEAAGLRGVIKFDVVEGDMRIITLWQPIGASIVQGDEVRLIAGCDRRAETCREKFANFINFQGFPDIPGDDWLVSVPRSNGENNGGSLIR